jgi:hypothetical protein
MLMNNPFVLEQSGAMADRVASQAGDDPARRVRLAWRLALGRSPGEDEIASALSYLERQEAAFSASPGVGSEAVEDAAASPDRLALASFCHALLCSNGFLYVD